MSFHGMIDRIAGAAVKTAIDWAPVEEGLDYWPVEKQQSELDNAQKVFKKSLQDGSFRKLHAIIKGRSTYYNATSDPKAFSFHAPIALMLDAMNELGWRGLEDDISRLVARRVYENPDSGIKIMKGEGDTFVAFLPSSSAKPVDRRSSDKTASKYILTVDDSVEAHKLESMADDLKDVEYDNYDVYSTDKDGLKKLKSELNKKGINSEAIKTR